MTLTVKSEPTQTEQESRNALPPIVGLEAACSYFAEELRSMKLRQRIVSINTLTDLIDHAKSPAAKADALRSDLRLVAGATRLKKLAR